MDSDNKMIPTKDLSGPVLSWYAARLAGHDPQFRVTGQLVEVVYKLGLHEKVFDPDLHGEDAMRLLQIHRVNLSTIGAGWMAYPMGLDAHSSSHSCYNANAGVAVARCVVSCQMGHEVAYPVELHEALQAAEAESGLGRSNEPLVTWGVDWDSIPLPSTEPKRSGPSM